MEILDYEIDYRLDFDPKTLEDCGVKPRSVNGTMISSSVLFEGGDKFLLGCNDINGELAKLLVDVKLVISSVVDSGFLLVCGIAPVHGLSSGYSLHQRLMNSVTVFSFDYLEVMGDREKGYTWGYDAWSCQAEVGVTYPSKNAARQAAFEHFLEASDFIVPKEMVSTSNDSGSVIELDPVKP